MICSFFAEWGRPGLLVSILPLLWSGIFSFGGINTHLPDKTGMKRLLSAIIIVAAAFLSGCAPVFLVGAGVGAGAFSYAAGNLSRMYEADYQQSVEAGMNVMEQLSFKRKEESDNQSKTIIEGYLYPDTPVKIEVVYIDTGWTQIGVRTGYYGIDTIEKSEQVHTDIAEELKALKRRNLQAISKQRRGKRSQSKPQISQIQYEAASTAAEADKVPVAIITNDTKKIKQWDEAPSPAPETETTPIAGQTDEARENKQQDDTPSPALKTETAAIAGQTDGTQTSQQDQQNMPLVPNKSNVKAFIYYPKSNIDIPPGSYVALDDIASQLIENPSTKVDIQSFTDSSGSKINNLTVSHERAYEIRNYLIERGIAEERITAQGFGATNFLESNRNERLRALNRRVEITIR